MQNFNALNKNILILTIVLFALIAALSAMLNLGKNPASSPEPSLKGGIVAIDKNITELNSLDADLALFAEDDIILQELNAILGEVGEINDTAINLMNDEENLNNLNSDLTSLSGNENVNKEIDQSLQEVSL